MHSHTLSRKECRNRDFFSPELSPKLESGANRANQTARFAPSCSLRLTPNDVIPRKSAHGPAGAHDEESASRCHSEIADAHSFCARLLSRPSKNLSHFRSAGILPAL